MITHSSSRSLPHPAMQPYRGQAKRFGYLFQLSKERCKDSSLDLGNAGEKVKALINAHLISLGINPKVPPVELLAEDFLARLPKNRNTELIRSARAAER